jgi:hypothetical protein
MVREPSVYRSSEAGRMSAEAQGSALRDGLETGQFWRIKKSCGAFIAAAAESKS